MIQPNLWGVLSLLAFHTMSIFILFPSRYSKVKTTAVLCSLFVISFTVCWMMVQWSTSFFGLSFAFCTALTCSVVVTLFLSAYDLPQTIFIFLLYAQAFIIAMTLSAFISQRFFAGSSFSVVLIRTALHFGIILLCIFLSKKFRFFAKGIIGGWWPLDLVEILFFAYTSIFALHVMNQSYGTIELITFFIFLLILIAVYVVFFHTIRYMHLASEQEKVRLQSKFLLEQMKAMQESMNETRRMRHDTRHHNLQIMEYIKNNEQVALLHYLEEYLGEYEKEAEGFLKVRICENLTANSILCVYARKAEQTGIAIHFYVSMEQDIAISDTDVVAILANLMENAINGCILSEKLEPLIYVYIAGKAGELVIYIRNTARENIVLENGLPQSEDGIGISSILHSASRYGGEYDFRLEDGMFSCQLLLKIPEKGNS